MNLPKFVEEWQKMSEATRNALRHCLVTGQGKQFDEIFEAAIHSREIEDLLSGDGGKPEQAGPGD